MPEKPLKRELLIMRHGKSDRHADTDDFHRPIKDRGKRGAQRMAIWLLQQNLQPDFVISSPAERALVTAQKTCKAMGMGSSAIIRDRRIYQAALPDLLEVLADCPDTAQRVLLVGHNPALEQLLGYLADKPDGLQTHNGKLLPTATLARVQMPGSWQGLKQGSGKLKSITRPRELPKKFPFPAPDGTDMRDRPAYYYTQSSVIPYRIHNGEVEILIVSSSQQKHWVVPKGIKDPGLSDRESAAKEAWEEAGVEGTVAEAPLGSYRYAKWGSTATVSVYPMAVNRIIPEQEWEERHRGRQWVSAQEAAKRLKQPELHPMVIELAGMLASQQGKHG
jgi:phosphohistidine phosphatase